MITLDAVENYLENHLSASAFVAADETTRAAALAMADCDIAAELGGIELDDRDRFAVAAVAEQLLYLLERQNRGDSSDPDAVASERIDGVGSRTYRSGSDRGIAPRARRLVVLLRSGAASRIGRG